MEWLTIADIAKKLDISQSTARFYRDKYNDYFACIGEGRSRRYQGEAVEAMEIIIDGYKQKQPSVVIESRLSERFGIPQPMTTESKQQIAEVESVETQPIAEQMLSLIMEHQKQLMIKVADMESKLEEQRIAQIHFDKVQEEERAERLKLVDKLDKQDEMLKQHYALVDQRLRTLLEAKEKPKTFWRKIFG